MVQTRAPEFRADFCGHPESGADSPMIRRLILSLAALAPLLAAAQDPRQEMERHLMQRRLDEESVQLRTEQSQRTLPPPAPASRFDAFGAERRQRDLHRRQTQEEAQRQQAEKFESEPQRDAQEAARQLEFARERDALRLERRLTE